MNTHPEIPQTGFVTTHWVKKRDLISNWTLNQWIVEKQLPAPGPRAVRFRAEDIQRFEAKLMTRDGEGC